MESLEGQIRDFKALYTLSVNGQITDKDVSERYLKLKAALMKRLKVREMGELLVKLDKIVA